MAFLHAALIHEAIGKAGGTSALIPITDGGHSSVGHPEVKVRGQQFTDKMLRGIETTIDTSPIQALPDMPKTK